MVNMTVVYQRPDNASWTLWQEILTRFGSRAQTKGFVTGYKSAGNITSHNADINGVTHAIDIGVDIEGDGTGLTVPDADWLAEHLRALGMADWRAGRPGRLAYIIYKHRICGDHTGWVWVPYTGSSPHLDHIHVSTCFDFYWGDPVWGTPASDYDSTAPWGVSLASSGGSTITPIVPEEDIVATLQELEALLDQKLAGLALEGKDKVRNAGPLYPLAADVAFIRDTLSPGVDKVRHAGAIYGLLHQLATAQSGGAVDPNAIAKSIVEQFGKEIAPQIADQLQIVSK